MTSSPPCWFTKTKDLSLRWADTRGHVAARNMLQGHVAATKLQHVHTHENVAGTCFRGMLQRHVSSCELILL